MFRKISKRFKNQLWYTYTLLIFEFVCQSITPWLLGKAIDSLLQKQNEMFGLYVLCCITGLVVGTSRRIYDTKVFTSILRDTSIDVTEDMFRRDIEPSKISVRINRLARFTEFFEYDLPQYVKSFVQIIVSAIVLFSNIHHFIWIIGIVMTVSLFCSYHASQKSCKILKELQTQDEIKQYDIVNKRSSEEIKESFFKIQKFHVNKSNIDALNWSVYDVCCILCELLALYALTTNAQITTGQIAASLMYVTSFTRHCSVFTHAFVTLKELKVTEASIEQEY